MNQIKKILAPTDLSEPSLPGLRYALDLAKTIGAEVTVFQVFDSYKEFLLYGEKIRRNRRAIPGAVFLIGSYP